ncbi:YciI family protein [Acinetobacter brisouii]|uniref:YciI family protein n=1 Tax=Acinetobacter brisouii TaxID=396323 RepID=UPI00125082EA|nr:YciI family protein [Acinetobacter brisouii]
MALFVVSCTDQEGTLEQRIASRPAHLARLEQLNAEGRLIVAGPMPKQPGNPQAGFYGSTLIVDFDSREDLDDWLKEEPYLKAGVYSQVDVKPFIQVFPKG